MEAPRIDSSRIAEVSRGLDRSEVERREKVFSVSDLGVSYSGNVALEGVDSRRAQEHGDGVHRPVGLREEHVHPLLQPHERPHPGCQGLGHGPLPRPGSVRPRRRRGRDSAAHRHGLPEAEPVPEVDLRQRRLRTARARDEGIAGRARRTGAAPGGALGRGEGSAEGRRSRPLGRAAAAAVHRPCARGRARRDPHGRAGIRARPDLDDAHRGSHARAEARVHDRHRHAQHAAGGARRGHDRVLQRRRRRGRRAGGAASSSSTTRPRRSSRRPPTSARRTTSRGRFG